MKKKLIIGTNSQKLALLILLLTACLVGSVYAVGYTAADQVSGENGKADNISSFEKSDEEAIRINLEEKKALLESAERNGLKYEEKPGTEDEEAARKNREEKERLVREALESNIKYEEKPGFVDEEAARKNREEKERLVREALESNIRYEEKPGIEDEEAARKNKEEKERIEQEALK